MQHIAVIGAGTMGAGIAQLAATSGCRVHLIDVQREVVERGVAGIRKHLDRSVEKGRLTAEERDAAFARIMPADTIDAIKDDSDIALVIEAVVENIEVKRKVFAALERAVPASAVLATNTSSLSVTRIAESVADPSRVVGMHFFNPAPIMPLVEIVAGRSSAESAVALAFDAAASWGKTPVRAKDTPGFIVNRVARGFYLEALRLLGEGVAGVDEIDAVLRRCGGFKMGPFELMDLIGVDVNYSVSVSVWEQMGRVARFEPHAIQRELVEQGRLGRKTGRGFYQHDGGHPVAAYAVTRDHFEVSPLLGDVLRLFCTRAGAVDAGSTEQLVFGRVLGAVINEAGYAFAEKVAGADDIDTAMVKGTNYPSGPLAWADEIGHRTVGGLLKGLNAATGDGRYQPAPLFVGGV